MNRGPRPRLAVYWASACGGCQAAFLDLGDRLLDLERRFDIVLFPLLMDGKEDDLERLGEGEIDLCLISGAIRNAHDTEMVQRLRERSRLLVALGACAQTGSVLGLANLASVEELLESVYGGVDRAPCGGVTGLGETIPLPPLEPAVVPLSSVVPVDLAIPGCPPEVETLETAMDRLLEIAAGREAPPPAGATLGASDLALCEECPRDPPSGRVTGLVRPHQADPDPRRCLLDQGLLCLGPATRGGCGAACLAAGAGCRGCYGPLPGVTDQGGRMLGALVALGYPTSFDEGAAEREAEALAASVVDPVGSLYRFSLAASLLGRLATRREEHDACDE